MYSKGYQRLEAKEIKPFTEEIHRLDYADTCQLSVSFNFVLPALALIGPIYEFLR